MSDKIYAGIGSRETPADILNAMTNIATKLSATGWLLRSGAADGADTAFETGALPQLREIHLPWSGYNHRYVEHDAYCIVPPEDERVSRIAAQHHPVLHKLGRPVRAMMCRNVTIILGLDLKTPAKMVICWTPNGKLKGGTAQGIRVAEAFGIPVFNLALEAEAIL
jgi:hypothetical protein